MIRERFWEGKRRKGNFSFFDSVSIPSFSPFFEGCPLRNAFVWMMSVNKVFLVILLINDLKCDLNQDFCSHDKCSPAYMIR